DRASEIAGGERGERRHQRDDRRRGRKDGVPDVLREDPEDDEVVELERAAEAGEEHDPPALGAQPIPRRGQRRERSFGAGCHAGVPSSHWLSVICSTLVPSKRITNSSPYGCGASV